MLERLLRDAETRCNRPLAPREGVSRFVQEWHAQAQLEMLRAQRPELLVTITTYRRPAEAAALIESLAQELEQWGKRWFLCVFNDRADIDSSAAKAVLQRCCGERAAWFDAVRHLGKRLFWRTHQMMLIAAHAGQADFLLSLQDDAQLAPDFMPRLWRTWERSGADPSRRVLYLLSHEDDEPGGRWVPFARVPMQGADVRRTDWFDLQGFLIDRRGLELLRYWVVPVPPQRWRNNSALSSGVGRQFSLRLFGRASTYQCDPPLIAHGSCDSLMNAEARAMRSLDNRTMVFGEALPPISAEATRGVTRASDRLSTEQDLRAASCPGCDQPARPAD